MNAGAGAPGPGLHLGLVTVWTKRHLALGSSVQVFSLHSLASSARAAASAFSNSFLAFSSVASPPETSFCLPNLFGHSSARAVFAAVLIRAKTANAANMVERREKRYI